MVTKKNRKGFTLIELLVVIAIIGLLSTLAVVALGTAQARARDAKRVADVKSIQTALSLFNTSTGGYPVDAVAATAGGTNIEGSTTLMPNEMAVVPTAPAADTGCTAAQNSYFYESTDATVANGVECNAAPCAGFELNFCISSLVGGTGGLAQGQHCVRPNGVIAAVAACDFAN